jgi:hypothetical protein
VFSFAQIEFEHPVTLPFHVKLNFDFPTIWIFAPKMFVVQLSLNIFRKKVEKTLNDKKVIWIEILMSGRQLKGRLEKSEDREKWSFDTQV